MKRIKFKGEIKLKLMDKDTGALRGELRAEATEIGFLDVPDRFIWKEKGIDKSIKIEVVKGKIEKIE